MRSAAFIAAAWGLSTVQPATAATRFFASAAQCEHSGVLSAGACRTAFANAMAEFAAKAPSFRSRRACFKQFGPCMPWPIGTHRFDAFRPQWIGVTVDADASVTPAVAPGRLHLDFAPQSTAGLSAAASAAPAASATPAPDAPTAQARIMTPDDDSESGNAPAGHAGGGFTMIDGVLTYPAPARFQPKTLKHP